MGKLRFFYFDMGNVLLYFDHRLAAKQMGEAAGVDADVVWREVFESDLQHRYERGELDNRGFYDEFCQRTGGSADLDALLHAGSDIFQLRADTVPVIAALFDAGHRLGVLSNTCQAHWDLVADGRYVVLSEYFELYALSFRLQASKPDPAIYKAAAELAGAAPEEIFFTDDRPENVESARQAGYDAVLFESGWRLADELRKRGVDLNI